MQIINLQYAPTAVNPVVHVSQNDIGRPFKLKIYDGTTAYTMPSGTTARIDGIKPDRHGFSYSDCVSVSGNEVTVTTKQQMTIVAGEVDCEIRFAKGGTDIGTLNFKMLVEPSPINEDTDISETDLPEIIELGRQNMLNAEAWAKGTKDGVAVPSTAPQYHDNARYWNDQAQVMADDAEAWARGTRDGTAVGSGDETFHNNSKFYSEQSASSASEASTKAGEAYTSATDSANQALKSEGYAVGTQNGTAVSSGPYFHNNSKYYAEQADASADSAEASATASSGSATQAHQEYLDAKAQADRAEAYADFLEPHFVIVDNRLCIADDAVGEFIVADNRLCMKFIA